MIEEVLTLPDGRRLGFGVYGSPRGAPVFDFHGIPGSRREAALIAEFLAREDICLVGFDRPGYGRSTARRGFQITDLPADAAALADHLGMPRFAALGYSGGGPFALAAAWQYPERVAALALVSAVGPAETGSAGMHESNRKKFNLARSFPWLARLLLGAAFANLRRKPETLPAQLERVWRQMPEPDRAALQDRRFAGGILAVSRDAIACTAAGWAGEEILMAQPWRFRLEEVRCARIDLWHGEQDRNVPAAMARATAARLANCQAHFLPGEGHLSLLYRRGQDILSALVRGLTGMPGVPPG